MTAKKTAHIISHTHWDREWYLPYEKHHALLIKLMDTLLDTLESDRDYRSFYLDGQTIILDDYLQVRPDNRTRLEKLIRDGRIHIGPWYILQDAFLTSGEANLRNLLIGHQDASRFGTIAKVGYFPDTFGNIGQAPQILRQAGIDNAVFGRGVKPTGFNNAVSDSDYESSFSELIWEGPDGSRVLGILFANWYCNGMEVPVSEAEARQYWEAKLTEAEKYASTGQLLFMNGCDHQPIQQDLSAAIREANRLFPDTEFVHSNFADYLAAVGGSVDRELSIVKGELRSQRTDGWSTLVNTASARVYLKQLNQLGQVLLEKVAEPLAAFAHGLGAEYPGHLLTYAWKTLMQNHPHDSICGCSIDEVHREMVTRFDKSRHSAETIAEESKRIVADRVDTTAFRAWGEDALPVVVFNTTGWIRSGTVTTELDIARIYYREGVAPEEMIRLMKELDISGRMLIDLDGVYIPCTALDLGVQFGYDLPADKFRQPYWTRRVRLSFEAARVPTLGLKTYAWVRSNELAGIPEAVSLLHGSRTLENEFIRVDIAMDGSLSVTEKSGGRTYRDLCLYEDTGDIGNEYMYKQPDGETPMTTKGFSAQVRVVEDTPYRAAVEILHEWSVPESADETFETEKREAVYFPERKARRTERRVPLTIRTLVSLERGGKGVKIRTEFDNQAKDHRIRALFPSDILTPVHRADAIFEVAVRDNETAAEWNNPSNCQHQQAFVDVSDELGGLTIASFGLNEYEVLRDGRNTMAVTLLRSVSELGDWGVFPTPEAQCLGKHKIELEIIPHTGDGALSGAYAAAYQFQIPWTVCQTGVHEGRLTPEYAPFACEGVGMAFSSWKINGENGDTMLRWYNMRPEPTTLTLSSATKYDQAYRSDVLESAGPPLTLNSDGQQELQVGKCEIVTIGIRS